MQAETAGGDHPGRARPRRRRRAPGPRARGRRRRRGADLQLAVDVARSASISAGISSRPSRSGGRHAMGRARRHRRRRAGRRHRVVLQHAQEPGLHLEVAPENAPLRAPKSGRSATPLGIAAQLTATKRIARFGPAWGKVRAACSLPAPLRSDDVPVRGPTSALSRNSDSPMPPPSRPRTTSPARTSLRGSRPAPGRARRRRPLRAPAGGAPRSSPRPAARWAAPWAAAGGDRGPGQRRTRCAGRVHRWLRGSAGALAAAGRGRPRMVPFPPSSSRSASFRCWESAAITGASSPRKSCRSGDEK